MNFKIIFLILAINITPLLSTFIKENDQPYKEDFSIQIADQLGGYSAISYCLQKRIETWNCGPICDKFDKPNDIEVIYNKESNIQAFTSYNTDLGAIILTFRGTMPLSLQNWLQDADDVLIPYPLCEGCEIHRGFFSMYSSIQAQVWESMNTKFKRYPNAKIYVTGQSLGGAMATIAASELISKNISDFIVYNYGSPRVFNIPLFNWFSANFQGRFYRITHSRDPVVHEPQQDQGYHHVAEEIFYPGSSEPYAYHKFCNMSGEDPKCADQFQNPSEWIISDHNVYMGYNFLDTQIRCSII